MSQQLKQLERRVTQADQEETQKFLQRRSGAARQPKSAAATLPTAPAKPTSTRATRSTASVLPLKKILINGKGPKKGIAKSENVYRAKHGTKSEPPKQQRPTKTIFQTLVGFFSSDGDDDNALPTAKKDYVEHYANSSDLFVTTTPPVNGDDNGDDDVADR